jgi:exopolysaccharide biosynthesis predicted pyruvyltransferase EpsI
MNKQSNFYRYLQNLNNPKVFFVPTKGNRGDELIIKGAEYVLTKLNLTMVSDCNKADYIVINGGGFFNPIWDAGNKVLRDYRTKAPSVPIIMGPQTYRFNDDIYNEFCEVCALTDAPIILFCREMYSYELLQTYQLPQNVSLEISDDFAFELEDSEFIEQHRQQATEEYILISMRLDKESSFFWLRNLASLITKARESNYPSLLIRLLSKLQRLLIPLIYSLKWKKAVSESSQFTSKLPFIYADASSSASLNEFCDLIDKASLIVTDRLHVSIYAHLLNKQVMLFTHPSYYKIKGVYEYTMRSNSKIKLS